MTHPIAVAALAAGFLDVKPATAHPLDFWRETLDRLPFGKIFSMEHRPEALSGWPAAETTIWSAILPTPPFNPWPDGYGEVSSYYTGLREAAQKKSVWEQAVKDMGYEVLGKPLLPFRAIAVRAGLGVTGLFGPLITPLYGSFVSISTLRVRAAPPKEARGPEYDRSPGCERCGKCAEACPTGAITEDGFDAMKCLRKDIEFPDHMPEEHFPLMERRIMGCDTCQRVCPHNRKIASVNSNEDQIAPFGLGNLIAAPDIDAIAARITKYFTRKTTIHIQAVLAAANTARTDLAPRIQALTDDDAALRRAAGWALKKLSRSSQ
jgi:epoxyqueuosine reductase